ncbi:MgPP2CL-1 [[Candida] subhashii]|uniref:MgPP2CL-1 n=1 Tax=[Candida] subhashii TaxID=561895 RepID=A0A8J5QJA4_9ASCO|nr:MgPP2CL-1 [[Candida] subhashii]KAG7663024.1 MgPP2CL-1 [[Candida] subhashii]
MINESDTELANKTLSLPPAPPSSSSTSSLNKISGSSFNSPANQNDSSSTTQDNNDPFNGLSFRVGVAENKNTIYRNKMEDVHTYIANFAERVDWGYFAIFDGHAGKDTARWCGNNLHSILEQDIDDEHEDMNPAPPVGKYDIRTNLCRTFVKADELIAKEGAGSSGCTAAVAVLRWETDDDEEEEKEGTKQAKEGEENENKPVENDEKKKQFDFVKKVNHKRMLYTSNVGDSRIVLSRRGKPYRLSYDHKATDLNEMNRIRDSGGLIMKNRVNGVLAVTRSLGDSYMKDLVIGKPFTTATEVTPDDEYIILACDGVWDVISDSKACSLVTELFSKGYDAHGAAKKLCQLAMDNSTTDNVTVMIVKFDKDVFNL